MYKKYRVTLTDTERAYLETLTTSGKGAAQTHLHARILLKADQSAMGPHWTDQTISTALDVSIPTIERVRCALVTQGLDAALHRRRPATRRAHKLDGSQEAHLVALVCGPPPQGAARWTLTLLADQLVELKIVDSIATETVRQTLKKTNLSRG
jgi:Homeodomain-like domain